MLSKPFSGVELFGVYESQMGRIRWVEGEYTREELIQEEWHKIGKQKKEAWNAMAKHINQRMRGEA